MKTTFLFLTALAMPVLAAPRSPRAFGGADGIVSARDSAVAAEIAYAQRFLNVTTASPWSANSRRSSPAARPGPAVKREGFNRILAAPGSWCRISKRSRLNVEFTVRSSGQVVAQKKQMWQPQRKWKVIVVKSSHEDLGYENYIFMKQHDIANYIDLAANISKATENVSDLERKSDAKYHYTMETLLFERNYIEERGERAWREIVEKDIKTGAMNLMGAPSGVHSHWMDYEELARMTYPARREMPRIASDST